MKKRINPKKIILGTASAAALISPTSCESDFSDKSDSINKTEPNDNTVISIKLHFSNEETEYFNYITSLTDEIIHKPEVAKDFAKDPASFVKNAGFNYNFNINPNDNHIQTVLALGDPEIRGKLEAKDLKGFMTLCKERGYAINYSGNVLDWLKNGNSNLSTKSMKGGASSISDDGNSFLFPVFMAAAAAFYTVYYYYNVTQTRTQFKYSGVYALSNNNNNIKNIPISEILLLEGQEEDAYMLCEEYIEQEVQIIIDYMKTENPEITKEQEIQLTNFLKKNLININDQISSMD